MSNNKSQTVKITGIAKWAKVYDFEEFRGSKNWKIDIYPDAEGMKAFKASGIQKKVKKDEDGEFFSLKREVERVIKGALHKFHGPKVFNADGTPIVTYEKNEEGTAWVRKGEPVLIGNGSKVEVTATVYDTAMGKGHRVESVRVLDLIEYSGSSGFDTITVGGGDSNAGAVSGGGVKAPW